MFDKFITRAERLRKAYIGMLVNWPVLPVGSPTDTRHVTNKGYVDTAVGAIKHVTKRQTVITGAVDGSNNPAIVSVGTALNSQILATAVPLVLSFANGFDGNGPSEYIKTLSADRVVALVSSSGVNYHYIDYNPVTDSLSSGANVQGYTDAVNPTFTGKGALLRFEGTNGATSITDDYGNTWTAAVDPGFTISTTSPLRGTASGLWAPVPGNGPYFTTPDISLNVATPWTWETMLNITAFAAGNQTVLCTDGAQGIAVYYAASTGKISVDINDGVLATNTGATVLTTGTTHHLALEFNGSNSYKLYIDGVLELTIAKNTAQGGATGIRLGMYSTLSSTNQLKAKLDDWRITLGRNVYGGAFTPPATQLTMDTFNWFDIKSMKMFSGNPVSGWTQIWRLFVGQATAGAASITNAISYLFRGKYDSGFQAYTNGATFSAPNCYFGTPSFSVPVHDMKFLIAQGGYAVGDVADDFSVLVSAEAQAPNFVKSATALTFWTGTNLEVCQKAATTNQAVTPADVLIHLAAERSY